MSSPGPQQLAPPVAKPTPPSYYPLSYGQGGGQGLAAPPDPVVNAARQEFPPLTAPPSPAPYTPAGYGLKPKGKGKGQYGAYNGNPSPDDLLHRVVSALAANGGSCPLFLLLNLMDSWTSFKATREWVRSHPDAFTLAGQNVVLKHTYQLPEASAPCLDGF